MTPAEKDQFVSIMEPHFPGRAGSLADGVSRAEAGIDPKEPVGQSIERWIVQFGIAGADKTFLEGFYPRLGFTPGEDDMEVG
jgi:hypothetical protein